MLELQTKVGISGYVKKVEAIHADTGVRRILYEGGPNQILLSGMQPLGDRGDWMNYCQVGTSDAAVSNLNTSLQGWVAGTNTVFLTTTGAQSTPPYYGWKQKIFRFPILTGTNQNLNEVGVGWDDGRPGFTDTLLSRALIVDILGVRSTPTWVVGEYLDVTYELRYYPPLIDVTGNVTINGLGFDYILRALAVTSTSAWGTNIGALIGQYSLNASDWSAYDGAIGAITASVPSGIAAACDNANQYNFAVGSPDYTQGIGVDCGLSGWNLVAGLRCIRIRTTAGDYQLQLTADGTGGGTPGDPLWKTAGFHIAATMHLTWAEGTIP